VEGRALNLPALPARLIADAAAETTTPEWLHHSGVVRVGPRAAWVYGAVPTRVLPLAVRAALKVAEVFELNFGPYSFFWPL
jgi:hypothetical protein